MLTERVLNDELDLNRVYLEALRLEKEAQHIDFMHENALSDETGVAVERANPDWYAEDRMRDREAAILELRHRLLEMQNDRNPTDIYWTITPYRSTVMNGRQNKSPEGAHPRGSVETATLPKHGISFNHHIPEWGESQEA